MTITTINEQANKILTDSADFLEENPDRWHQGQYWWGDAAASGYCKMCAHGIIAYQGDPSIRANMEIISYNDLSLRQGEIQVEVNYHVARSSRETHELSPLELAHKKAFDVGLSIEFNDLSSTTVEQVITLLRKAALN